MLVKNMPPTAVNRLLQRLPLKDSNRIFEQSDMVDLTFGTVLCEPNEPLVNIYFPLTSFISLVMTTGNRPLETGLIGNEGMLGATLALGVSTAPQRGFVQGPGTALRLTASRLSSALDESPALLNTLNHYLYILMVQLSQTAVCSRFHDAGQRLARWLLMTHDRAHTDGFYLTHQHLADMLGVQRGAVTIAAGLLQQKRIISYSRGHISILDRKGLEAASCECYRAEIDDYSRFHF